MTNHTAPLLSLCIVGRNDNYMPDFLYRMSITINYIAESIFISDRHQDFELIILDWQSRHPLRKSLSLSKKATQLVKFIMVHPGQESRMDEPIPMFQAVNTAYRYASGSYISVCGADVIIPAASIKALFDVLEGRSIIGNPEKKALICGRFNVPFEFVDTQPDAHEWDRFLRLNSWFLEPAISKSGFLCGGGGVFVLHRELVWSGATWLESLDPYWGWADVEKFLRLMSYYDWYDLRSSGVLVYNMTHQPDKGTRPKRKLPPKMLREEFDVNAGDWGKPKFDITYPTDFTAQPVPELKKQVTQLDMGNQNTQYAVSSFITKYKRVISASLRWGELNLQECYIMLLLGAMYQKGGIKNCVEIGCRGSKTFLFSAAHYQYLELIGIDSWPELDHESGPDHISMALYDPPVSHRGYLRLINRDTESAIGVINASEDHNRGLDVLLINSWKDKDAARYVSLFEQARNSVSSVIVKGVVKAQIDILVESLRDLVPNVQFLYNDEFEVLMLSDSFSGDIAVSRETLNSLYFDTGSVQQRDYHAVVRLFKALQDIPEGELILYGLGSITELVLPHLRNRVLGVTDRDLSGMNFDNPESLKLIEVSELGDYPDATIVITASLYDEEIRKNLSEYSNSIHTLYW